MIVKYFTSIDLQGKFLVTLILPRQALQFTIVGKAVIRLATTFCLINPSRARLCARYVLLVVNKQRYHWVVVVVKGSACSPSIPTIRVQILLKPTVIGIDIGMLNIKANPDLFMLIFVFYNRSVDGVLGIQTWHCRWIHCAMTAQMCVPFQQGIYKADTGTTRFVSYIQPPQK